jgi:hypothetical protein
VGAGDDGTPIGLEETALAKLDETVLRKRIEHHVCRSLDLFLNKGVNFERKLIVIITVLRSRSELVVYQRDGQYEVPSSKKKVRSITAFRAGDVFVRHRHAFCDYHRGCLNPPTP